MSTTNTNLKLPYSNISLRHGVEQILAATLEVWCHQLLYQRCVYPRAAFGAAGSFQGVSSCKACRHPQVASYISDTVQVAVPALLDGMASELALRIVQRDAMTQTAVVRDLEIYKFQVGFLETKLLQNQAQQRIRANSSPAESQKKQQILQHLDSAFRNIILAVLRLPRGHVTTNMIDVGDREKRAILDQLSFELTLDIVKDDREKCPPLTEGFDTGTWSSRPPTEWKGPQNRGQDNDIKKMSTEATSENLYPASDPLSACLQSVNTQVCGVNFLMVKPKPPQDSAG